jgi:hypothetical protein
MRGGTPPLKMKAGYIPTRSRVTSALTDAVLILDPIEVTVIGRQRQNRM